MDFNYTDAQRSIAEMIRDFANKHIRPQMMEWDETQKFPVDLFHKMGELGLMGVLVQEWAISSMLRLSARSRKFAAL